MDGPCIDGENDDFLIYYIYYIKKKQFAPSPLNIQRVIIDSPIVVDMIVVCFDVNYGILLSYIDHLMLMGYEWDIGPC